MKRATVRAMVTKTALVPIQWHGPAWQNGYPQEKVWPNVRCARAGCHGAYGNAAGQMTDSCLVCGKVGYELLP